MNFAIKLSAFAFVVLFTMLANGQQRSADDPWWFEIEAIVFERNISTSDIEEDFPLEIVPVTTQNIPNFIADTLIPDFSLLRAGAKQCLQKPVLIEFPLQITPPKNFNPDIINKSIPTELIALSPSNKVDSNEFRKQILSSMLFQDDAHILENSPTSQWLTELALTFQNLNQDFSDWREEQFKPVYNAEFEMAQYISNPSVMNREFSPTIKLPKSLYCQWPQEFEFFATEQTRMLKSNFFLDGIPKIMDGIEYPFSDKAYVLPADKLKLSQLRRKIQRTRGLNVLLHTAWRQNVVVGRDRSPWYRLYAGKNLSKEYNYTGLPRESVEYDENLKFKTSENLFDQIQHILESPSNETIGSDVQAPEIYTRIRGSELNEEFEEVWTLDGRLKVFIEYIGGTPYLHIDSDLNYRKPKYVDWMALAQQPENIGINVTESELATKETSKAIAISLPDNFLQAYHFDQLRRLISNEIHYFDHPLFGMVFQIRRHRRPDPELPPDYYQ